MSQCLHWNYSERMSAFFDTISRVEIRLETALELHKVFVQGAAEFILTHFFADISLPIFGGDSNATTTKETFPWRTYL